MKKNFLLLIALAVLIFVGWYSFSNKASKNETTKEVSKPKELKTVSVSYRPEETGVLTLLDFAEKKGFFEKNNIKIDRESAVQNVASNASSGSADVSISQIPEAVSSYLNDQDSVWIYEAYKYPSYMSAVSRLSDVSQDKVAPVNRLGGVKQVIHEITAKNLGINGQLKYVVAPAGAAQLAMLDSKTADLIITSGIYGDTKTNLLGKSYKVINGRDVFKNLSVPVGVISSKKVIDADSGKLSDFLKALKETQDYMKSHNSELVTFLKDELKINDSDAKEISEGLIGASTAGVPKTGDLSDIVPTTKSLLKPKNANKDLNGFVNQALLK